MSGHIGKTGLRLTAPQAGDVVTVRVKSNPKSEIVGDRSGGLRAAVIDGAKNPHHYRMTTIFKVVAVNGGQAVVERLTGYRPGARECWPIGLHEWFEASELFAALGEEPSDSASDESEASQKAEAK